MKPKPPNILFLMSDEHRADVSGFAGNQVVQTPVLDELAATGVVFQNAYTPSPICIPGRQSLMSGQFPKTSGCEVFGEDLEPGYMTFARRFAQHAYAAVACGKLHHLGSDQMQGWTQRIAGDMAVATRYIPDRNEEAFREHLRPFSDFKWSDTKEIMRAGIGRPGYVVNDDYAVQGALDFVEQYFTDPYYDREQKDRPMLLKVSLNQPHYPYMTSAEKFNYYLNRVPLYEEQEVFPHPFLDQRSIRPGVDASERELRRATAAYYGMIEAVDELFGKVLDALEHVGENLDDWIVLYTSDHGEMLGEHSIWEKQKFFEGSVRVPLIIRWPSGFGGGRVVQENVNLCDLFATLCDLAGIPTAGNLDSRSLVPLLNGQATGWNNETISQFNKTNLMIKRDHLKYQYYGEEIPEVLFDLERNPEETRSFVNDPTYATHVEAFRKRCAELGFGPNADTTYVNAGY